MKKKSQKKYHTIKNNLFLLKQIHKASPGRILFTLLVIILQSISTFLFDVYMLRYVINSLQTGAAFQSILLFVLCVAAYHFIVCIIGNYYIEIFAPISDQKIYQYIQNIIFSKALSVEIACFEDADFYDRYVKATSEATQRASQVLNALAGVVKCIFTVFAMSFVIFTIDPLLIVFALIPFVVNLLFGKKMNQLRYNYDMEMQEKSRRRDYVRRVFYLADYAKEIRLTQINKVLFVKFYDAVKELKNTIKKHCLKISALDYLLQATNDIVVYLGAIVYASYQTIVAKNMLYGDCVVVINTINSVAWSLRGIVDIYLQFQKHAMYLENLKFFLEYQPLITSPPNPLPIPSNPILKLQNVSFRYNGSEYDSIKNISLTIHPREKIAFVGLNGAGKTTLIKLLLRLYDVTDGEITLNDVAIKSYDVEKYRNMFGTVFQDFKLFAFSALQNVLLTTNITQEDRDTAINGMKSSGIYDKISSFEEGVDTILTHEFSESGAVFSGGESQKLAIARVFAKPCSIVILDEPSSALDPISEHNMYEAMMKACENKTVIFISHRLSSATMADRIYYMENGQIIEEGSHSDLLKQNGKYAEMWYKQAEKYQVEVTPS